mgnify:CR=1 FL=1
MDSWNSSYKGISIKLIKNQGIIQINYNLINEIDVPFAILLVNAFLSNIKLEKKKVSELPDTLLMAFNMEIA